MFESVKNRRTIRRYEARAIEPSLLRELLETSFRAATMGGMQLYSVVVTEDAERKAQLAPYHFNQPMITGAPVVLTFCADCHRATQWCEQREAQPGFDNPLFFLNAMTDAMLVVQNFCNLAEEAGLGTCYIGTTIYDPQAIIDLLHLPHLVFPVATITVGYPAEHPAQTDRLPAEALIHSEQYTDYTPEAITRCYAAKEALEENKQFVVENAKATLAQVFTDIRYTKEDNELMSRNILAALRKQGFLKD